MRKESVWVKPVRTVVQTVIGLIPVAPLLVDAVGLSATAGIGASVVAVAASLSRLMQVEAIEKLLSKAGIETK
jgi:predicted ribonuclease YlaK